MLWGGKGGNASALLSENIWETLEVQAALLRTNGHIV